MLALCSCEHEQKELTCRFVLTGGGLLVVISVQRIISWAAVLRSAVKAAWSSDNSRVDCGLHCSCQGREPWT